MVHITLMDKIGIDERGYTYEYFHERMGRHLVIFRKAGTVSGRHYHKGLSLNKNPEVLLLLSGSAVLNYRESHNYEMHTITLTGPVRIEMPPFIWHEVITQTDCTFLELGSLSEHEADTFYDQPA